MIICQKLTDENVKARRQGKECFMDTFFSMKENHHIRAQNYCSICREQCFQMAEVFKLSKTLSLVDDCHPLRPFARHHYARLIDGQILEA